MNTRDSLYVNYIWLLWLVGVMLGLRLGYAVPVYAAPPGQGEDTTTQTYDLLEKGARLHNQGDLQGVLEKFQMALPLLREVGDQPGEAAALGQAEVGLTLPRIGAGPHTPG